MFLYLPTLDKNINGSLKDLDIVVEVPGVPKVPSKDIPLVLRDRSHRVYQYFVDAGKQMFKSAGVVVNTFGSLEPNACKAIEERKCSPDEPPLPPIFCVGPLTVTGESKKENECLTWLDSQPSRSVLYLCFGSMGDFSSRQLKEMATGLEKSGVRFLWVVRAPKEDGETQARKAGRAAEPLKLADEDDFGSAAELEERVTELMNSNKGEAVRERVRALREAAVVAKSEGGSAHFAMERLVDSFK
ncbi:hypothetical protein DKX38_018367 [Salix brachista]|uniref:Uncharacterized protein n=1 Tax=Salix brachista TaxID=2182728 RepID=A0A5N5KMY9_9ROSI|nr:hypothetical protein DKX38_018367 [Salix brachista]